MHLLPDALRGNIFAALKYQEKSQNLTLLDSNIEGVNDSDFFLSCHTWADFGKNLRRIQTRGGKNKLYGSVADGFGQHRRRAYSLLKHQAGELLDLKRESEKTRANYGHTMVGQSLLMARRLVESGVSLVTVNWEDETKIDGVNTCWDTHQNNFSK